MLALFLQGKSYRAIGEVYGMSGEGARKIVAPIKTPNAVGGYSLGAKIRAASVVQGRAAKRDARTMKNYGQTYPCYRFPKREAYALDIGGAQ